MRKAASLTFLASLLVFGAMAQPGFPPPPSQAIPLDLVVGLLLLAGTIFGLRKLWKSRNLAKTEA